MSSARKEELFCAKVLESTLLSNITLSIGDSEKDHLPDLYTANHEYGLEVIQLEKQKDFRPVSNPSEDNELFHSIDWVTQEYFNGLKKKHEKLNSGRYSGIHGDVDLCVCAIKRATTIFYPKLILYLYRDICDKYQGKKFKKIFFISSTNVFVIHPDKISKIAPVKTNKIIYDFEIEGNDYLQKQEYEINDFF